MKKIYMMPTLEVMKIQTACILAASDPDSIQGTIGGDIDNGYVDGRESDMDDDF